MASFIVLSFITIFISAQTLSVTCKGQNVNNGDVIKITLESAWHWIIPNVIGNCNINPEILIYSTIEQDVTVTLTDLDKEDGTLQNCYAGGCLPVMGPKWSETKTCSVYAGYTNSGIEIWYGSNDPGNIIRSFYVSIHTDSERIDFTVIYYIGNAADPEAVSDVSLADNSISYVNTQKLICHNLSYTRTFNNTNLQALYVPFSMTYSDWSEDFDIYSINGFFEYDTDDDGVKDKAVLELMKVKEGSGDLKPNYPYVIKAKEAGEKTITLTDATLYATEINSIDCSTVETKYTFTGTYSRKSGMKSAGYYALAGGELCPAEDDDVTLGAFRWYMSVQDRGSQLIPRNSNIKIRIYGEDDDASRIEGVEYVDSADDAIYTIDGRLVKSNSLRPGLYIKNGKKFFVNK